MGQPTSTVRPLDPRKVFNEASRKLKELRRGDLTDDDDDLQSLGLSSIGEALDWSPDEAPREKKKKKGIVRLSSLDNQCYSTL